MKIAKNRQTHSRLLTRLKEVTLQGRGHRLLRRVAKEKTAPETGRPRAWEQKGKTMLSIRWTLPPLRGGQVASVPS